MRIRTLVLLASALLCLAEGCGKNAAPITFDYEKLNAQARHEYLQPVHPGLSGEQPFWNGYSFKFIYAPAFDFKDVEGAASYSYTASAGGRDFSFRAEGPREALSEIWDELPVGEVTLCVQGLNAAGEPVGEPQRRSFAKDHPFCGPYEDGGNDYLQAAIRDAEYVHLSAIGQGWTKGAEPDMEYGLNCYPSKIWSGTIRTELFLAEHRPQYRQQAMQIARNAADALIAFSQKDGDELPGFPPTYFCPEGVELIWYLKRVIDRNRPYTMFADAVMAADALLDIYDATKEKKYFEHACKIAETYRKLQAEDGSWPVKVSWSTGEPVTPGRCMPTTILQLAARLKGQYGVKGFDRMISKTEEWLWTNTISSFNFNGQFEDVTVADKAAYQNLTNCIAVDCVDYLLSKEHPSKKEIAACCEIVRFAEDQFTRWQSELKDDSHPEIEPLTTPFVYEQYSFQCPIDSSTACVAMAWMHIYRLTGDLLALAKAKALLDTLVKVQDPETGCIPTSLYMTWAHDCTEDWSNCAFNSIRALVQLDGILNGK